MQLQALVSLVVLMILQIMVSAVPMNEESMIPSMPQYKRFRGEPIRFGKRAPREPIRFGKRGGEENIFDLYNY